MVTRHRRGVEAAHIVAPLEFRFKRCRVHALNQLIVSLDRILVLLNYETILLRLSFGGRALGVQVAFNRSCDRMQVRRTLLIVGAVDRSLLVHDAIVELAKRCTSGNSWRSH